MSYNRGLASGQDRTVAIKADGTRSNTAKSAGVPSAIIGYFDRYPRIPFCRQTAFNAQHTREFDELRPALEQLSSCFRASVSERYEAQMSQVQKTSPDFVIGGTPWTTITVNHNWSTCAHTDKGDLDEGFSCLAVLRQGAYRGGVLVFPAFRVGVDLLDGDLIMMDAHEVHGNTMLVDEGAAERISMVLYYRTKMRECGSAVEELARAKTIRGDLLTAEEEAELSP
ncbi:MAG TPA: hypothetical protein VJ608_10565 [Albitalea sp.]|nr:hypothetical protein [Albitalea sp.]